MDYHPTPAAEAHRQRQIHAHVLRVIWCSIEARMHDLAGRPAAARDASLDAEANARCARAIAGVTGPVNKWRIPPHGGHTADRFRHAARETRHRNRLRRHGMVLANV